MWIWESSNWPNFTYDNASVMPALEKCIQAVLPLKKLSELLTTEQRLDWEASILLDETLASAKIEGENFDRDSVRSSIVNKLGLHVGASHKNKFNQQSDSMVELLLRAIRFVDKKIDDNTIKFWHQLLFPVKPLITPMTIDEYRNDEMQILSGKYGKQKLYYLAPSKNIAEVSHEMTLFFNWLNSPDNGSAYIRAAIAKFWFVTIHPFDDGNGRLSRIIAERCLAEAENTTLRLFSLSSVFEVDRAEYYQQLELHQGKLNETSELDLTQWIIWFLSKVEKSALDAQHEFERVMQTTRFWQKHQQTALNTRQQKLINRLLETSDFSEGISRNKYKALVKTSDATAIRDLADLVDKQILTTSGGGRSYRYFIA